MAPTVIDALTFDVAPLTARPDSPAQNQVLVTFATVRERDEVRARASNLRGGDRSTGCQLEPPDHLRAHYKAFQNLAFCLKKKSPGLKRNIKFDDAEQTLVMDVKMEEDWKTVHYTTAKGLLKLKKQGTDAISRKQLRDFLSNSDIVDSDDNTGENTVMDVDDNNTTNEKRSPHSISFINTNARSLTPKMQSLDDCFQEKCLDLAIITETWFQTGRDRDELVADARDNYALGVLTRERDTAARNGRQYGGVAIIFRLRTTKLDVFPLSNPNSYEVLAAVGKITGVRGKVFVLACYAPPNLTSVEARGLLEYISDIICEAKRTYADCTVLVCGDFNQWPVEEVLEDHPDLTEVEHGPTRGNRSIDRSLCNFGRSIKESGTLPPLETEEDRASDHRIAFATAVFQSPPDDRVTYSYRPFTERGAQGFVQDMRDETWQSVITAEGVDAKAEIFQSILDQKMNLHFPMRTTTKRKSDPPWVNDTIRRLSKKRRKIYDKHGRSRRWKALKKLSDKLYRDRAANYFETQKRVLTGPDACRSFYRNVKAYRCREKPADFDPRDLFPDKDEKEVAENIATHFNSVSKEFKGLTPEQVPTSFSSPLPQVSAEQVKKLLLDFRKPKSKVPGDLFPDLVNRSAQWISTPLASIYNCISTSGTWPTEWKTEYVTPIPKKTMPETCNDLRNISCTKLFSKVYESFLLPLLTAQAPLRKNQYGGVKGLGTEHFLVGLWQGVLEDIDDSRAGTLLTSIDYSKAFNRLDFACCLKSLKAKGVCTELLKIVASFLSGRKMTVKVGKSFSNHRTVEGGVPQGSLLGVFLFNATIDGFEAYSKDVTPYGPHVEDVLGPDRAQMPQPVPNLPPRTARDHKHLPTFKEELLRVLKYVDDNIVAEKINFDKIATDGFTYRDYHASRSQNLFQEIVARAEHCGMRVNSSKTGAMLISEIKSYRPKAHFFDAQGSKITTTNSMKILGFHFSSDPDMTEQVNAIKKKYRTRMWILRHLGHNGFNASDLLRVYQSVILPCHDYCSVVYHSSLTTAQTYSLERLQSQALKCIYGYEYSYRALLEISGLTTLQVRRENRCIKFAQKCLANDRMSGWFPLEANPRPVRDRNRFKEFGARTSRLMNSPIYHMRRKLNSVYRQ